MLAHLDPKVIFLTVNRNCNMNCKICYAREASGNVEDMSLELACELTDLAVSSGTKKVTLIGGEPTVWQWLNEYNRYVGEQVPTSIVTNALAFADHGFVEKYSRYPNTEIGMSLKASDVDKLLSFSKNASWDTMLNGISEGLKISRSGVTFVCTPDDHNIINAAKVVKSLGGASLSLNLYRPSFLRGQWRSFYEWSEIKKMIQEIVTQFPTAEEILDGKIILSGKYPLCVWPKRFRVERIRKRQISTGCILSKRRGLVFNSQGGVLMCNHLYPYVIGRYGVDFTEKDSFFDFLNSKRTLEIYDQTSRFPSLKCKECAIYEQCTGGCAVLWTYFQPDDIVSPEERR